ncbi:isoliquiritigenin 2'-O-methyltransferase [Cajanus cajan]|uniref:isoliquiritigenin 2'-O-methyltransferase n=1 Tax=Cajanus cajan TaxID=3821 RepID=UPI00098DCA02|nr:isoliquiritigenin 2'-O-methyltransferase [Cajanus cajan]
MLGAREGVSSMRVIESKGYPYGDNVKCVNSKGVSVGRDGHGPNFKDAIIDAAADDLFNKVHGMSTFQYADKYPAQNHIFNKAVNGISTMDMKAILQEYTGFEGISTLVNVGGGIGEMLHMIISKYPSIKGINFDLPHVVEKAPTYPGIEHVGGDMYVSVPQGDAIILKAVLHNWSDEDCLRLLRNCHKALPQNGKVIVVDLIVPEASDSDESKIVSIIDNLMFVIGGKERTTNEFEALSKLSGFPGFEVVSRAFGALGVMEFHK